MTEDAIIERRTTGRIKRLWWAVAKPGRLARFRRWRKSTREVTRGFLLFRDIVLVGFMTAIVMSGVATVRSLRADDCRSANARRTEIEQIAQDLLSNDRNLIDLADAQSEKGLPDSFTVPLFARYMRQQIQINEAFRPANCPGPDFP